MAREFLRQQLAPCGGQRPVRPHPQNFGVIAVGDDQARVIGQQFQRKSGIYRPEKPVAPVQIALPFAVGLEIGTTGFAFDHPDFTFRPQRHDIDAQPQCRHQFFDADEIMTAQMTAHATGQSLAGQQGGDTKPEDMVRY